MPVTIRTQIDINASADTVSSIIYDFNSYPRWNSWIDVTGPHFKKYLSLVGTDLVISENDSEYQSMIMMASPTVLTWIWYDIHKFCMVQEHYFEIIPGENSTCVFKHGERFSGSLAWARTFTPWYEDREEVFKVFNQELKRYAEAKSAIQPS